jgi:ATP-dependent DNA helicase RecQ
MLELSQKARAIISFDEFVCLYELIMAQYQNIAIIENSLYKNFYPVDAVIPKEVANLLLCHFDPEADENSKISAIGEYTQVYSNFLAKDGNFVCCHSSIFWANIRPYGFFIILCSFSRTKPALL